MTGSPARSSRYSFLPIASFSPVGSCVRHTHSQVRLAAESRATSLCRGRRQLPKPRPNGQQWAARPSDGHMRLPSRAESPLRRPYIGALGAIAQLGERLLCKQEVTGSIPVGSIRGSACKAAGFRCPVVLDSYSGLAESTAGEYHIGAYFGRSSLAAAACRQEVVVGLPPSSLAPTRSSGTVQASPVVSRRVDERWRATHSAG